MAALDNFTPNAATTVKLFAYAFRSAATADLVVYGANQLNAGVTPGGLLDFLFNYPVAQSPFTAYSNISSNTAFATALVDNFAFGTSISAAVKAGWVNYLVPLMPLYSSRGAFAYDIERQVEGYAGTDADLLALKGALAERVEKAAVFAQSPAGALYNGQGFAQLTTPLLPPATYALTAGAQSVNEGSSVTFTLQTTFVAVGTTIGYTLSGSGLAANDIAGALTGQMTVNANGVATLTVTLLADNTTEGPETLRITLAGDVAQAQVAVNDTSTTPPLVPTYALSASHLNRDEGGTITFTLATTNLQAGTTVAYALSGTGITAADLSTGALSGFFTVNAEGLGTVMVGLVADAVTEGPETLRMTLSGNVGIAEVLINDTSTTPQAGAPDTVLIADNMNNNQAHAPASPAEGEIPVNTYLTFDFLNQSGPDDVRMSVAALKNSGPTAGAALVTTNQSADRGNLPQLSNQGLFTLDLGLLTDRVDYSAETGKIVALVTTESPANWQYVLVNDDSTNDFFGGATDRMDILKNVEEVVASAGGGVLDLTSSGQDLQVTFSRNFNSGSDVDASKDRATHRVEILDLNNGLPYGRSFFEFRDAGLDPNISQATAAWTSVQGSDRNETVIFGAAQSVDARFTTLRGGINSVKFNELTRSILVDVAITPWVASTNLADDTNFTGRTVATTTFTNGDGITPLSGNTNVISSHAPDNNITSGMLKLVASQDAEDAISFNSTALPKWFTLGQSIGGIDGASVRLAAGPESTALELSGFELLRDNGASDDVYAIDNIFRATQGSPRLTDGAGNDHDTVRLANEALGSAAVGGSISAVNLATLNGASPGFGVDFDVLDLSPVTNTGLQAIGTAGTDDELVVGRLATLSSVTLFESLVLTRSSIDKGSALILDLDAGAVKVGSTTLFSYAGSVISAGGLVFNSAGQASAIAPMDSGISLTVVDSTVGAGATVWGGSAADLLVGGTGDDKLRGGAGNDTLDGGIPGGTGSFTETWAFTLNGTPDAVAAAANRITIAMTIDGTALTLTEAAVADTVYGDGNGAVLDGSSRTVIGTAMAGLINANLASINAGPGSGTLSGASYDSTNGTVLLSFLAGVNANDVVTFVLNNGAGPDGGTFTLSAGVNVNGGNGGIDTFVFEKTAALNGRDTILNFTPQSDKLDVSAYAGASIAAASPAINAATGGTLAGASTTVELIYNKSLAALSANDFATGAGAGKFVLADNTKIVVAVTADPTGSRGDAANTPIQIYFIENGPVAGLSDLSVSLVGVVSGPVELTLIDIFNAMT